jgi:predicted acylesterase/phospholipase RssA
VTGDTLANDGPVGYLPLRMNRLRLAAAYFLLLAAVAAGGCTHKNRSLGDRTVGGDVSGVNRTRAALGVPVQPLATTTQPIVPGDPSAAHPATPAITDADGVFCGIAISGGGSRSANFAAACMFQLERFGLLQKADYVSAVSGGSLTAAYYCLATDRQWRPTNLQRRMTHSFATDVIINNILPWNFLALTFSDWDRSDLLADTLRKHLFTRDGKELTFGDLRADRPRLLINATDLQTGKPFVFSNESFDRLNSDLASYPIAHAVAASAAVPVLLHHVTLRDHSSTFKQYRHLIDGGVTDNLGIRTLTDLYVAQTEAAKRAGRRDPYPRGAVFLVLDARTEFDAKLSDKADIGLVETLSTGAGLTSTVLINRASSATLAEIILDSAPDDMNAATLRKERGELIERGYVRIEDLDGRPVYVLHLALTRVNELEALPFQTFSRSVNSIATYFNIKRDEVRNLYLAAELLVAQRFNNELKAIADELNSDGGGASAGGAGGR